MGNVIPIRPMPSRHDEHREAERARRQPLWRDLVGAFLRQTRTEQERILADVAGAAGVSTQYLSEIERGRKEPSSEILGAVADALGLTLHDIAAGVGAMIERQDAERMRRLLSLRRWPSSVDLGRVDSLPEVPGIPGSPEAPEPPETPFGPGTPSEPEEPNGPLTPAEPDVPLTPDEPVVPLDSYGFHAGHEVVLVA
ncbi:MAG: helix-turn-helix transcriptional regulator [Leifsonia sp.]